MKQMKLNLEQKVDLILESSARQEAALDTVALEVGSLRQDVDVLKTDVSSLKTDVGLLGVEVSSLRFDVDSLKENVSSLDERMRTGFDSLDAFVYELQRHDVEITANRSAIGRHEERLEILETTAA